ncbi:MAG: CBS domain-containing protein [Nitrososphaeraceae archaeon]|nr:CBS domain-containing protein [Nitrososphaeraceae archaeon]
MSSPLVTIASRSSPCEAADIILQHNVRHLLVLDNADKPIGTPLNSTNTTLGFGF